MDLGFSVENCRVFCFLQDDKHYYIFWDFFPSVMLLNAVCQGLVLRLCSLVNSEALNRYLNQKWSGYARLCHFLC